MRLTLIELQAAEARSMDFARRNRKRNHKVGRIVIDKSELSIEDGFIVLNTWYRDPSGSLGCVSHSFGPLAITSELVAIP